jgi:hypothetical protein
MPRAMTRAPRRDPSAAEGSCGGIREIADADPAAA